MVLQLNLINLFFIYSQMSSIWWILMTRQLITITNVKNFGQMLCCMFTMFWKDFWDPFYYSLQYESSANLLNTVVTYLKEGHIRTYALLTPAYEMRAVYTWQAIFILFKWTPLWCGWGQVVMMGKCTTANRVWGKGTMTTMKKRQVFFFPFNFNLFKTITYSFFSIVLAGPSEMGAIASEQATPCADHVESVWGPPSGHVTCLLFSEHRERCSYQGSTSNRREETLFTLAFFLIFHLFKCVKEK